MRKLTAGPDHRGLDPHSPSEKLQTITAQEKRGMEIGIMLYPSVVESTPLS